MDDPKSQNAHQEDGETSRKRPRAQLSFLSTTNSNPSTVSGCLTPTESPQLLAESLKLAAAAELQRKQQAEEEEGRIGPFSLLSPLDNSGFSCHALDTRSGDLKNCQVLSQEQYEHLIRVTDRLEKSQLCGRWPFEDGDNLAGRILPSEPEIIRHKDKKIYLFSGKNFGSFHGYVQTRKKLEESTAKTFYSQIVRLVAFCHCFGIVVRDLKLRKFVFADQKQTELRLASITDLVVCKDYQNDILNDRQGCPAYVSPEILDLEQKSYSGKLADIWSLGVMLFVILIGRYPFYASTPAMLFSKIRQGLFFIPPEANLSEEATFLLRGLLRREPKERPSALCLLKILWIWGDSAENLVVEAVKNGDCGGVGVQPPQVSGSRRLKPKKLGKFVENDDQIVPCVPIENGSDDNITERRNEVPAN